MISRRTIMTFSLLPILLVACSSSTGGMLPTIPPTQTPVRIESIPATSTPRPTQTPYPSDTPTVTLTPLPSETPTLTPDPLSKDVTLAGGGWVKDYDYFFTFQFKGPVDPKNYRVVADDKEYVCQAVPQKPDLLYCLGQGVAVLDSVTVRLYQVGVDEPVFEKDVWVDFFPKK